MNRTGTNGGADPDQDAPAADDARPSPAANHPERRPSRLLLLFIGALLVLAVVIGAHLFAVFYSIIFPARPPLPPNARQIRHENIAYGVDEWVYGTDQDGCEVGLYYQEHGGLCIFAPGTCGPNGFTAMSPSSQNVASCTGREEFSIFNMRWEVSISSGYTAGDPTRFILKREVFWIGAPPVPTSAPPP